MSTSTERMRRLRERRVAALTPADGEPPRPAQMSEAVAATLEALGLEESDAAAAELARRYAAVLDSARDPAWAYRWVGPLLLACLAELEATPSTRKAKPPVPGESQLDRLRAARKSGPRG